MTAKTSRDEDGRLTDYAEERGWGESEHIQQVCRDGQRGK